MYFNVYLHLEYMPADCIVNALLILQNWYIRYIIIVFFQGLGVALPPCVRVFSLAWPAVL